MGLLNIITVGLLRQGRPCWFLQKRRTMGEEGPPLPSLQPDIWLRIFHKLRIRYVLRCKAVCKEWRRLISDPYFTSNYNLINPLSLILLPPHDGPTNCPALSYEIDGSDYINRLVGTQQPFPSDFVPCRVTPLGSYNGLIALHTPQSGHGCYCLFNPCTKEEKVVHLPHDQDHDGPDFYGLCHDPVSDEYTVVVSGTHDSLEVSFKDGKWRRLKTDSFEHKCAGIGVTVKGVPHWMCNETGSIIYYNGEEFGIVELPLKVIGSKRCGFGALDGKLTVAMETEGGYCDVWALKEYGNADSWSMLFEIYVRPRVLDRFTILTWKKDDGEVLIDVINEEELLLCDVRKRSIRQLHSDIGTIRCLDDIVTYYPSLVSPVINL